MCSALKPFTKYVLSFKIKNKEKRKELLEVFKFLVENMIITGENL
jgi:hypothetical protein